MASKHLIVANWKMKPQSPKEAQALFTTIKKTVGRLRSVEVVIAPPALFLEALSSSYTGNKVQFAAQAISKYSEGSHTGSLSAAQYRAVGAEFSLVGHSERQDEEKVSLANLRVKTFTALTNGLIPIIFVGEKKRDNNGTYLTTIKRQILSTLKELADAQVAEVIFCYEPIWAIGKHDAMGEYDIHQMVLYIRKVLVGKYRETIANKVSILYGGSVNSENLEEILKIDDIDGVAIGRASLDPDGFGELLKLANKV